MDSDQCSAALPTASSNGNVRRRAAWLAVLVSLSPFRLTHGVELDGSARFSWTETAAAAGDVSTADQNVQLGLSQMLTPYLRFRLSAGYADVATTLDGDDVFSRRTERPRVELLYGRPNFSARLGYELDRSTSSIATDDLETGAVTGSLSWRARSGFRLNLSLRESTNRADIGGFGRDVDERRGRLDLAYDRVHWGIGYGAAYGELERIATGLVIEQLRHDLRFHAGRDWRDGRFRVGLNALAGRVDSREQTGNEDLGEPLPALSGLAVVDPSPATGALEPLPALVDGDLETPTSVEIGGGNTFRNVGVDLGLSLPATRLEIHVDRPSGPALAWEAYHSADNLFWEPIGGVTAAFDSTLLRYTLRFPEVTDRYLKAVNVSANPAELVRVTEVRALREIAELAGQGDRSSDLYRAGVQLGWRVGSRVYLSASGETTNDETAFGGFTRRDLTTTSARGGVRVDLHRDLRLSVLYSWLSSEDRRIGRELLRSTEELAAHLQWVPLPTVDALFAVTTRDELDDGELLATNSSARLSVSLQLLEELRLVSDLTSSRLESHLADARRDTTSWTERIEVQPFEHWRLDGGFTWSRTEGDGDGELLLERTNLFATVRWSPGAALSFSGTLLYYDDATSDSLRQSYGLAWSPGPKLNLSAAWDEYEESDGRLTGASSFGLNYRLSARMQLFASYSESRTDLGEGGRERVSSIHTGAAVSF